MEMRRRFKQFVLAYDFGMVGLVVLLSIFGVIVVGSATGLGDGVLHRHFTQQILWFGTGLLVMFAVSVIDYRYICRFYILFGAAAFALLILVLITQPDLVVRRWLPLPFGLPSIQPSEFSKLFMLIFFAKYIEKMQEKINNILVLFSIAVIGVIPIALVFLQPSLSVSVLKLVMLLGLVFMSGVKLRNILIPLAIAVPIAGFMIYDISREETIVVHHIFNNWQLNNRLRPFLGINETPDNLLQGLRSVEALSSGQMTGMGLFGNAVRIPLDYNDFIFAVIGAEFGFVGSIAVILVIFLIVLKCFIAAERSDTLCGRLLASGVGVMIGTQSFVHIGVTTMLLPNTGIPLPFVSAGGSSMWINLAAIGLVINVGTKRVKSTIFSE